jgi:MFS family permease
MIVYHPLGFFFPWRICEDPMKEEGAVPFNWVIVGASFITLALVYSVWYSFAVFFVILLKEFGWSRSLGAGAFSLFGISGCVVAPLVGGLISSLGSPRVLLLGALFLGTGLALCNLMTNWWQFYLYFAIIAAIGLGATGWIAHVTIIQLWFKEKRGLATGIISSGIGIGILISPPAVQHLILRFGWRMTYRLMAISIPLVIIFIAVAFFKKSLQSIRSAHPTRDSLLRIPETLSSLTSDGLHDPGLFNRPWPRNRSGFLASLFSLEISSPSPSLPIKSPFLSIMVWRPSLPLISSGWWGLSVLEAKFCGGPCRIELGGRLPTRLA